MNLLHGVYSLNPCTIQVLLGDEAVAAVLNVLASTDVLIIYLV